eukprot:TRINITY_DN114685_c0_g1_i1.p1 TRINITY_DN114685_c0_g1~~TRINITY_DN114685_c0_g1_i1.p1  ORF type:complete len:156 (-),score=34.71 TRINITY_DN114685_c0_g1_i1:145-612(-)
MGSTLRMIFSMEGFNRLTAFSVGAAGGYAFTNPDIDNVYDLFPVAKPPPFAFLNVYKVKEEEKHDFEEKWKEIARFNQRQDGYLFTKFLRADQKSDSYGERTYDYIDIMQWSTGDAFRRATLRSGYQALLDDLPGEKLKDPMMFSVVVDDTPAKA